MSVATRPDKLTDRQGEILAFLIAEIDGKGLPPTFREIATRFGINSPNGVMANLRALDRKGWIRREPNLSRAIRILRRPGGSHAGSGPMPGIIRGWLEARISPGLMDAIDAEIAP